MVIISVFFHFPSNAVVISFMWEKQKAVYKVIKIKREKYNFETGNIHVNWKEGLIPSMLNEYTFATRKDNGMLFYW